MTLFLTMAIVTASLHVSTYFPTPKDPKGYDLVACTAVFISENELLTAGHCLEHSRGHQWVKTHEGITFEAEIVKVDTVHDLGLIRLHNIHEHVYTTFDNTKGRTEHIYTVNSGNDNAMTYNEGVVNNLLCEDNGAHTIMHSASIEQGASGSGLFNKKGKLIGINTMKKGPFAYAVDMRDIERFLAQ